MQVRPSGILKSDYSYDGNFSVTRFTSPAGHHKIELSDKVNESLDGSSGAQEFTSIRLETNDGKFISLNDGTQEGLDKIVIGMESEEEGNNCIILQKGGDDVKSAHIKSSGNMSLQVEGTADGGMSLTVIQGGGDLDIRHEGTGSLNICGKGPVNVDGEGELTVTSSKDISIRGDANITIHAGGLLIMGGDSGTIG